MNLHFTGTLFVSKTSSPMIPTVEPSENDKRRMAASDTVTKELLENAVDYKTVPGKFQELPNCFVREIHDPASEAALVGELVRAGRPFYRTDGTFMGKEKIQEIAGWLPFPQGGTSIHNGYPKVRTGYKIASFIRSLKFLTDRKK